GRTSRFLRQEFPELLKLPSLWTHSYMFDTTGKISSKRILEYIIVLPSQLMMRVGINSENG
ncbi:MAG: transposase, partial [Limnoraphis robusta]|uniref:transposase n=1 Tax=Limnoraphis robusta TaxID=1118279 RepID=UPI002B1EBC13